MRTYLLGEHGALNVGIVLITCEGSNNHIAVRGLSLCDIHTQ